ncbi:MAG: NADH-quinone oxidoreductase subunit M, partial [Alphaproteobacteria bacterium]|nr:NADH-quinone oxidoreductase subunit M [Alphaproteobacteria bacterium]
LSVIAIIYASLVALVQEDMKKLVAYSSIAHMGFVTLGLFSFTVQGIEGAVFQMLSHGLISAALFLCVGVLYERLHTQDIARFSGIVKNMPNFAAVFMVFVLGAIGLPGTSGFVGEFLILLGTYKVSTYATVFAASGLVLGAAYMLLFYRRVVFGPQDNQDAAEMEDIRPHEILFFVPLVALVLYLGFFPNMVLDRISPAATNIAGIYKTLDTEPVDKIEKNPTDIVPSAGDMIIDEEDME